MLLCEVRDFTALHPASERLSVRAETRAEESADEQNQLHDEVMETSSDLTTFHLIGHPASLLFKAALLNILMSTKDQTPAGPDGRPGLMDGRARSRRRVLSPGSVTMRADEVDPSARDGRLAAQWDIYSK